MIVSSVNVPHGAGPAVAGLRPAPGPVEIGLRGLDTPARAVAPDLALERTLSPYLAASELDAEGLARALYAYPTTHHAFWRTVRAQARVAAPDAPLPAAAFDEHLALDGVQESQLWIGDVLRFPDCTLVVSQPRLPDARFNTTLGFAKAAKMVAESRWCGFWLAVRTPGRITAGEAFELVPGPRASGLVELFRARTRGRVY